jgi:hypothetical protein
MSRHAQFGAIKRAHYADEIDVTCLELSAARILALRLTVHKAQGSQWDDVVLFDESDVFRENHGRWLYTGVTRAAKRLTVVVP